MCTDEKLQLLIVILPSDKKINTRVYSELNLNKCLEIKILDSLLC